MYSPLTAHTASLGPLWMRPTASLWLKLPGSPQRFLAKRLAGEGRKYPPSPPGARLRAAPKRAPGGAALRVRGE